MPDNDALHDQNLALLAQVAELERELDKKKREVEHLGSQVTNLELDVRRRDEAIARLRAEHPERPPALMGDMGSAEWAAAKIQRLEGELAQAREDRNGWEKRAHDGERRANEMERARDDIVARYRETFSSAVCQGTAGEPWGSVLLQDQVKRLQAEVEALAQGQSNLLVRLEKLEQGGGQ